MMNQSLPIYYGGFDPGSDKAALHVFPLDGEEIHTIESTLADIDTAALLQGGDIDATLASVLRNGEYVLSWNGSNYALGDLVKQGRNARDELGNPARYWTDHARVLLLALSALLIPYRTAMLRLVTALPVTLYNRTNRQYMKDALSNHYRFTFNGQDRDLTVIVGYVAMEGQGILIHSGLAHGEQVVMDIGERTLDCIAADGQKLLSTLCGGTELGIGHLTDAVKAVASRYERVLPTTVAHTMLTAYAHGQPLPLIRASTGTIPNAEIVNAIEQATTHLAKRIIAFAGSLWNIEGERVGERFEQITIGGGGAYYLSTILQSLLPRVVVPPEPEHANIRGYTDLALTLEEKVPTIWEVR